MNRNYANIAFNLPVDSLFTYIIPSTLQANLEIGMRVSAQFRQRKLTGIVYEFIEKTELKNLKPIINILDSEPSLNSEMLSFCKWVADYYICPIGEVLFSAVPKSVQAKSQTYYKLNPDADISGLNETQSLIAGFTKGKPKTLKQLERNLNSKNLQSAVNSLVQSNVLISSSYTEKEGINEQFEKYIVFDLLDEFEGFTDESIEIFLKENKITSGSQQAVLKYLVKVNKKEVRLTDLQKEIAVSSSPVSSLAKKEILRIEKRKVSRDYESSFEEKHSEFELNKEQYVALNSINNSINENKFKPFLLFGVTGSGKTQVYIEAIKTIIAKNKTAIVLVPEISLTPQLIHRFQRYFGETIGVIHSRLSEGQRYEVFKRIKNNEIKIVIGARSALFAPLNNLGIIIVDEEHDHSYKQTEKNPKYNARDCAVLRASINNSVVVLGSATPSLETFYNVKAGKYVLLELPHRAQKTIQPKVEIVDMLEELKSSNKYVKYETPEQRFLSSKLISYIQEALAQKQSIILLQNRRGYSAYQECQNCGYVKMCPNCDITLIYHKLKNHLRCHYCGHEENIYDICDKCAGTNLELKGTGTEKVEEEIQRLFPKAKLKRMDADTVRRKDAHAKILKSFYDREFDILVGTQMISKGLDFPNVSLVGVVSADVGLMNPDFRAFERTFQLLMQVAGRPGRSNDYGRVVIQTMHADNYIFPFVMNHDYNSFFEKEITFRNTHKYPPFSRMVLIEVSGNNPSRIASIASRIYLNLNQHVQKSFDKESGIEVMKPAQALIFKIKNKYRYHIIIKSLKSVENSWSKTEWLLKQLAGKIEEMKLSSSERVNIDVDPLSFY